MIKAWLDDYKVIHVVNTQKFPSDPAFSMRLNNQTITPESRRLDARTYEVTLPKSLKLENTYYLKVNGEEILVEYRFVTKTKKFNDFFAYTGKLGSYYTPKATSFYLWAPTARNVTLLLGERRILMNRMEKGVYFTRVKEDLDGAYYNYEIEVNGQTYQIIDPYSESVGVNGNQSAVINPARLLKLPAYKNTNKAIIYECSVRDFTMDDDTDIVHKGKYLGFVEEGRTSRGTSCGLSYLKELGVTYVQLMPVNLNATIDEENWRNTYNWGYDPVLYTAVEGSYATNPYDPYCRIIELQEMVKKLHENDIGVIFDVVFNHIYHNKNVFEKVVPFYYFRYDKGKLANGSGCGNEFDSAQPMSRHLYHRAIELFMKRYGADGFRFDLMGLLDADTMNELCAHVKSINPNGMLYGEGWNMGDVLPEAQRASSLNASRMPQIGFFNDWFRNTLRGFSMDEQGYLNGDAEIGKAIINAYVGGIYTWLPGYQFDNFWQSINYLECHDDHTVFDRLGYYAPSDQIRIARCMMASIMLSQGVPFYHSGQEFLRTKYGIGNTYNKGDKINKINYSRKDQYQDTVDFFKDLVTLRKELPIFDFSVYDVVTRYSFEVIYDETLKININMEGVSEKWQYLKIIVNPHSFGWTEYFGEGHVVLLDGEGRKEEEISSLFIAPYTLYLIGEKEQ